MPSWSNEVRIDAELEDGRVSLVFASREAMQSFFEEALPQQAFLLPMNQEPEPFRTYDLLARFGGMTGLEFKATVVQAFPSGSDFEIAFQFADWETALDQRLQAILDPLTPGPEPLPEESEGYEGTGEMMGTSPVFRIKAMELSERIKLAAKADRPERIILCRDTMTPVLLSLLSNPRLDGENVLAIVKSVYANPDILQRVSADRRWLANTEIRIALVRNPKTPTPIAQRLLETLPMTELKALAKIGASKEDLRRIALSLVTKSHTSR